MLASTTTEHAEAPMTHSRSWFQPFLLAGCLALAGPSGSGKSTLARLVLGLETPDAGEVLFRGQPVAARTGRDDRRAVQAVFQNSLGAV
ncbi:MAG: ATP-binding cassette domain-containing protein, partial [Planctomycetes bacterium]|nr:ATP-binding cassette domain-containing protein [Planctomycetota bacterium]